MSGILEILIILVIVLIVFGASKLPALGDALGRMVRNFKGASSSRDDIEVAPVSDRARLGQEDAKPQEPQEPQEQQEQQDDLAHRD